MPAVTVEGWPRLRVADWVDTRDTLHLWTQIVGKVRLAHAPMHTALEMAFDHLRSYAASQ